MFRSTIPILLALTLSSTAFALPTHEPVDLGRVMDKISKMNLAPSAEGWTPTDLVADGFVATIAGATPAAMGVLGMIFTYPATQAGAGGGLLLIQYGARAITFVGVASTIGGVFTLGTVATWSGIDFAQNFVGTAHAATFTESLMTSPAGNLRLVQLAKTANGRANLKALAESDSAFRAFVVAFTKALP